MTFTQFDLHPHLLKSLVELGYQEPTPIQRDTIPLALQKSDIIGCAQTGTGKTAAFALPILHQLEPGARSPQALVITPTRELAEQVDEAIRDYARFTEVRCLAVYGGVSIIPQEISLRKGVDIVVATPGRLLDHLQRKTITLDQIRFLVLDEADRMLDMGFIPDIRRIVAKVPKERQTFMFSATMPPEIEGLARSFTQDAQMVVAGVRSSPAETVRQLFYPIRETEKTALLLHLLATHDITSAIIFARTKNRADRLARQLAKQDLSVTAIHSDRTQGQRRQALEGFKSGHYQILVATDVAARGLDIEDVSHVINYDTPTHPEDYVHRIGRTGRAHATGEAFTFTSGDELMFLKSIERFIGRPLPRAKHIDIPAMPVPVNRNNGNGQSPGKAPILPGQPAARLQARPAREQGPRKESSGRSPESAGKAQSVSMTKRPAAGPVPKERNPGRLEEAKSPQHRSGPTPRPSGKPTHPSGHYALMSEIEYIDFEDSPIEEKKQSVGHRREEPSGERFAPPAPPVRNPGGRQAHRPRSRRGR